MTIRRVLSPLALVIGTLLFSIGIQALAFSAPSDIPPGSDAPAPLNTSATAQTKEGSLRVKLGLTLNENAAPNGLVIITGNAIMADPSSKLGIGNQGPDRPLTFASTLGEKLSLYSISSAARAYYGFGVGSAELQIQVPSGAHQSFYNGASEKVRIDSNGNVGIGTTNPKTDATHTINNIDANDVWVRAANSGAGGWASQTLQGGQCGLVVAASNSGFGCSNFPPTGCPQSVNIKCSGQDLSTGCPSGFTGYGWGTGRNVAGYDVYMYVCIKN